MHPNLVNYALSYSEHGFSVIPIGSNKRPLIKCDELKENDESLEDTLLDLAGYSILGLKWLKEHENEGN